MILIFDDNEFRRKDIKRAFRDSEMPFKIEDYEHWEYLTKPLLTILVMPKPSEIEYIVRTIQAQGTIPVVVLKREDPRFKNIRHIIISENAIPSLDKIKKIFEEEYSYNLHQDLIGRILVDEEDKDIYFSGKRLCLTKTEYKISRFLSYNPKKQFTDEEIILYTGLKIKTSSLSKYVSYINHKCVENYRKELILRSSYGFKINDSQKVVTNAFE